MKVNSTIKLNMPRIRQLDKAAVTALEQTAEALHTEVVQAAVIPRKLGTLQNESTFVDTSESARGKVSIISSTPYARRLYFHPEYKFHQAPWEEGGDRGEGNANARGKWYEEWISGKSRDFCRNAFRELYRRAAQL